MALDVVDALVCWILVVPEDEKKSTYHTLCASLKRNYVISYQGNFIVRVIQTQHLILEVKIFLQCFNYKNLVEKMIQKY